MTRLRLSIRIKYNKTNNTTCKVSKFLKEEGSPHPPAIAMLTFTWLRPRLSVIMRYNQGRIKVLRTPLVLRNSDVGPAPSKLDGHETLVVRHVAHSVSCYGRHARQQRYRLAHVLVSLVKLTARARDVGKTKQELCTHSTQAGLTGKLLALGEVEGSNLQIKVLCWC